MIIKRSTVEKIRIEDVNESHRLDPVEVIIENYGDGAGKILISCWGESWTGFWGSMGGTVEEFFQRVSNDYLIDKMSDLRAEEPDTEADQDFLKAEIIRQRKSRYLEKGEARSAWRYVDDFSPDRNRLCYAATPPELSILEGMEVPWYYPWPKKENPKYNYLSRILDLVREVIKPGVDDISKEDQS